MSSDRRATSSRIIPGSVNQLGIGQAAVRVHTQTGRRSPQNHSITPFMYNEEEYRYARDEDGVEYPLAHEFFSRSNTHDPDQDGFSDLYRRDFIHALSRVARCKLGRHRLDPYQRAAFQRGIVRCNIGEEEADPLLETAMEYAGAVGVVVFDESCRLRDLTEDQVGRNQFAMDVAVDRLDEKDEELEGRADEASEQMTMLEGRVDDMEEGYQALLALGWDQVGTRVQACSAIAALTAIATDQQARLVRAEERMDAMREMILVLEYTRDNPIVVEDESDEETAVSEGEELELEENKVAIPIPPPGRLVLIEDMVQELPDELVGTQIAFDLAEEDRPPSYE